MVLQRSQIFKSGGRGLRCRDYEETEIYDEVDVEKLKAPEIDPLLAVSEFDAASLLSIPSDLFSSNNLENPDSNSVIGLSSCNSLGPGQEH